MPDPKYDNTPTQEQQSDKPIPGEERFVASSKGIVLIKPGKGVQKALAKKKKEKT